LHLSAADRVWLAVPLFWSFGSANAMPAILSHSGCIVLQESFEAGETLALIERERCSIYYGMANMARGHCQLSGPRAPFCGPAPIERAAQ
jgi:fatty-acyl-CoA synthase